MSQPSGLNPRADHLTYRSGLRNTYGAGKSRHLGKVPSQIKFACLPKNFAIFSDPANPMKGGGALHSQFYIFSFIELIFTFPVYFYGGVARCPHIIPEHAPACTAVYLNRQNMPNKKKTY